MLVSGFGERRSETECSLSGATIHVVGGRDSILRLRSVLAELCARCGQPGVLDDVAYYLSKPGTLKRIPCLVLISNQSVFDLDRVSSENLLGAALLYEYVVARCSIRTFSTNDRSGRSTLVAPAHLRSQVAEMVSRALFDRGALAVLISFRDSDGKDAIDGEVAERDLTPTVHSRVSAGNDWSARWARREREFPGYLPLESTYDATLARIGQRTRSNLRYYRRRAERQLGCTFFPAIEMSKSEFLIFNGESMYAVSTKVAAWRYDALRELSTPLFMGMKDRDGRWLSVLGGRRRATESEILWQMNRSNLAVHSLSLVLRSYFIEHEIAQGMTRLLIEGGTPHPMRFSFVKDRVTDLAGVRRSPLSLLIRGIAKHLIKKDNELAQMLLDKSLYSG